MCSILTLRATDKTRERRPASPRWPLPSWLSIHGIDFAAIEQFGWENATIFADQRMAYTEPRMVAYGYIAGRLVVTVYTMRHDVIRIISMRKTNKREVNRYG